MDRPRAPFGGFRHDARTKDGERERWAWWAYTARVVFLLDVELMCLPEWYWNGLCWPTAANLAAWNTVSACPIAR